ERDLDRVRVDLPRKADRLPDRLSRLAREPDDEGAVDSDAELVAVLGETASDVDPRPLANIVEDLLAAALVPDKAEAQAVLLQDSQSLVRHIRFGIAGPGDSDFRQLARDLFGARPVVGEGVVVEEVLAHLRETALGAGDLGRHVARAARAIAVAADGLRPQTKSALRPAAAARVQRNVRMQQVTDEVVLDDEIALVDIGDKRQLVHVFEDGPV